MNFHIDFESRSKIDLGDVGAYRYAEDDSTEIMMMAIANDSDPDPVMWINPKWRHIVPSEPDADRQLACALYEEGNLIYAHNAQFERAMMMYRGIPDLKFKTCAQDRWRCTAAMARKAALKDSLEGIGEDLGLSTQKDKKGKELIKFFSIPKEDGTFNDPSDFPDKFREFVDYCKTDVKVEMLVHKRLAPFELKGLSLKTFLLDIRLNDRGIPINVKAAENARRIIDEKLESEVKAFEHLTFGLRPTQRQKVKEMAEAYGVPMVDMKQPTLEAAIEELEAVAELDERRAFALKLLKGYAELNYAAAKKVHVMLQCVNKDGRVRGTLLYHGAGTGRWAGRLIQPQNFKKPSEHHKKNTDGIYKMICLGASLWELELMYGNAMDAIASCIRHFIQCNLDADYAQIEARIVCWIAGQMDALADYAAGIDQYKKLAADIYNVPVDTIENPSKERDLGKQAVLGCGFQMWWPKFKSTCAKYKIIISDELAEKAVIAFRERFDRVKQLWYDVDRAARNAIHNVGQIYTAGRLNFVCKKVAGIVFLIMTLPSGRNIVYPHPRVEVTEDEIERCKKEGKDPKPSITYYGEIKNNKWGRVKIYGGKFVENAVQGTAADIMATGADEADLSGLFEVLTLIHDQALAFGDDVNLFGELLARLPDWAVGLPVVAEAKSCPYYRK